MSEGAERGSDYDELFRAEHRSVVRVAYLLVGDAEVAREIAQEAFAQLFVHWRKVCHYGRPGAWVRRVAIRMAVRVQRRQALARDADLQLGPLQPAASHEEPPDVDLERALARLAPSQRAAVVLHYYEDLPLSEVAQLLGCAEATVRVHLHRARLRLSASLKEVADAAR